MEELAKVAVYAGPLALAAFAGTLLGGIALSFYWKNFGPWMILKACREECAQCHKDREESAKQVAAANAKLADLEARYDILIKAVERGGLGLQIGPIAKE